MFLFSYRDYSEMVLKFGSLRPQKNLIITYELFDFITTDKARAKGEGRQKVSVL
jgi:hypothetical protein